MSSGTMPLEGDGLIDNLYHFLWCKDDFGEGPRIYIPHTIVFKFTQPIAWYFTSHKTGKVKKKHKINLNNLHIEREFIKHASCPKDIVACYLYQTTSTIIEYFDTAGLHDFLFNREKIDNSILQRFVLPKGTFNTTIRAIWSPKICLLERRINVKNLYDERYSVYERGVTFDGGGAGELFSRPEAVRGTLLPGEIQTLCGKVVDHVTQVSYHKYRISRMVLHLKADAEDRLWLLWCSSLRLLHPHTTDGGTTRPLDIVSDLKVPAHVTLGNVSHSPESSSLKTAKLSHHYSKVALHQIMIDRETPVREGFQRCTSCAKVVEQSRMLTTNYKAVLEHFQCFLTYLRQTINERENHAIEWPPDEQLIAAAGGIGFGILPFCETSTYGSPTQQKTKNLNPKDLIIPPVIQYLHPQFSIEDLERHHQDPIFLHKTVPVCETCCLVYSDYTTHALEVNSLRATVPAILRPAREITDLQHRLDPLDLGTIAKPPASVWKPIPSIKTGDASVTRKQPSLLSHPKSSLHSLPHAPKLPERIQNLAEFAGLASPQSLLNSSSVTAMLGSSQSLSALKEESFFRDLYHQPGMNAMNEDEGHPLQHMLSSSAQLAVVDGVRKKKLAAIRHKAKESLQWDDRHGVNNYKNLDMGTLGKSASMTAIEGVMNTKKSNQEQNPYTVIQKLKNPIPHKKGWDKPVTSPSRKVTRKTKNSIEKDDKDRDEEERTKEKQTTPVKRFISSREARASDAHQNFLFAALYDAQEQLDHMESLASIVLPPSTTDTMESLLSPLMNGEEEESEMTPPSTNTIDELQQMLIENASLPSETVDDCETLQGEYDSNTEISHKTLELGR